MTNYENGKIYIIKSKETDKVYIGSTCSSSLKQRFTCHKSDYKKLLRGEKTHCTSLEILKYSDCCIELFEDYPCKTKRELLDREGEVIRNTKNCVNTQIQGRTKKEWDEDNEEKNKQYRKEFRENHKEVLNNRFNDWYYSEKGRANLEARKERINVKVQCPVCNLEYSKSNLARHIKSKHPTNN